MFVPGRSSVVYPLGAGGWQPGFNPAHPANIVPMRPGFGFSGVALGNGRFLNLLNGKPNDTNNGGLASTVTTSGGLGWVAGGVSDGAKFSGQGPTNANQVCTMAAIFQWTSSGGGDILFDGDQTGTAGYWFLSIGGGGGAHVSLAQAQIGNIWSGPQSGVAFNNLANNLFHLYFTIASANNNTGNANLLLLDMTTGQLSTNSTTFTTQTLTAETGSYTVGSGGPYPGPAIASPVCACMHMIGFMSIAQMMQWAKDPAGGPAAFWYPNRGVLYPALFMNPTTSADVLMAQVLT